MERIYQLYEEVKSIQKENNVSITSPWIDMEIEFVDQFSIDQLPKDLSKYPVSYILPKKTWGKDIVDKDMFLSPSKFLVEVLGCKTSNASKKTLCSLEWSYNTQEILGKSAVDEDLFDPVAIYTILRRNHYKELLANSSETILRHLSSLEDEPKKFKQVIIAMIAHNYYVTKKCQDSIQNALLLDEVPLELISDFIEEERGHDLILKKAIQSIDADPENLIFFEESKIMMDLLKKTTSDNRLFAAFCCLLEIFEGSSFEKNEPRAKYLSGFEEYREVSKCLQKHHNINIGGQHFCKGLDFLHNYRLINQEEAILAIRTFEMLKMLIAIVSKRICH